MSLVRTIQRTVIGRVLCSMAGLLLLFSPLAACNTSAPVPSFTQLDLGIPSAALNSPVVKPLPGNTVLHVRITFKIDPNLLKQAQNQPIEPGKPSHLENLAKKIGISDATYQKIKQFFSLQGISLKLSKLRTHLAVDARASTFAKLLQTKFVVHKFNGRTFYAPATPPKVPTFLANSIDAITGLDNYSAPPVHDLSMHFAASSTRQRSAQDCYPLDQTLLPKDVAGAYGYDRLWNRGWHGENMTVNLVEIDGIYREDVQNYFDCINFQGHLSVVNIDGAPTEALGESTLDVQMIAGLARSINMVVYQTDGNSDGDIWAQVNDELQQILNDNVNNGSSGGVVSISLGAAENEMTSQDARAIDSSLQQLTRVEHMTVFVASGDCGAFTDGVFGDRSVSFPASDPWATAVGGTILSVNGNHSRADEVVWADNSPSGRCRNDWGSGGGNSRIFRRPGWQNALGVNNRYSDGARQIPDVAAAAYGLAVYFQGQWGDVGGTSAAAPIWAAGTALVNEGLLRQMRKFGYGPQLFYLAANRSGGLHPYYDVTRGNNLYYPATPGWDFATGIGTPNLADFYQAVAQALG